MHGKFTLRLHVITGKRITVEHVIVYMIIDRYMYICLFRIQWGMHKSLEFYTDQGYGIQCPFNV